MIMNLVLKGEKHMIKGFKPFHGLETVTSPSPQSLGQPPGGTHYTTCPPPGLFILLDSTTWL